MNDTDAADVANTKAIATRAAPTSGSSAETNPGGKNGGTGTRTNAMAANDSAAIQRVAAPAVIRIAEGREATDRIEAARARTVMAMAMGSATPAAIGRKISRGV